MGLNIRLLGHGTDGVESLGLGTFDGLHLGHQEILNHCTHLLNLYPHPARVLQRNKDLKRITTTRELRILHPQLLTLNFNKNIAQLHAKEFLEDIIWTFLKPKKIVVGYDYKFGRKKTGDIHYLKEWAKRYEIEVIVISPFKKGGRIVKSSEIRDLLAHGDFNEALELLGHDYLISGVVTSGDGRGKSIGFPTANLRLKKEKLVPGNGVFMGTVDLKEKSELALVYIGKKPTFGGTSRSVEIHIPEFSGDLYSQRLNVHIKRKLRSDQAFESADALTTQIKKDVEEAKKLI